LIGVAVPQRPASRYRNARGGDAAAAANVRHALPTTTETTCAPDDKRGGNKIGGTEMFRPTA